MEETDEWGALEDLPAPEEPGSVGVHGEVRASLCRTMAQRMLKDHGISEPPVPIEEIARKLGFEIAVCDLPPGVDARMRTTPTAKIIELARGQAHVRHRFSIAHEIGHSLLGHRHGEGRVGESEANIFAGSVLTPRAWLARDVKQMPSAAALAQRYQVSREVIFIAAREARLLGRLR